MMCNQSDTVKVRTMSETTEWLADAKMDRYWTSVSSYISVIFNICFSQAVFMGDEQIMTNKFELSFPLCGSRPLTVILQWAAGTGERCQAAEPDKPINQPQDTAD